ncbi:MAG: hypothetical protein QOJ63_3540 [Solirubrobacteraceae bacterium]|nr:hypothetical protein [Solirubrobacteraceae bacterium]
MRRQGLPVRDRMLSWEMVGLLSLVGGVFVVSIVETLIVVALTLMGDRYVPGVATTTAMAVVCVGGAGCLTLRQWLRIRRIDRRYWPAFRAAVDALKSQRPQTRNTLSGRKHSEVDQQLPHLEEDDQSEDRPRWPRHMPARAVVSADRSDHDHGRHG